MAVAAAECQPTERPVERQSPFELAGVARGVIFGVGFVEGIDLLQKGLEKIVIHVSLAPFGNHLRGKLFAEFHFGDDFR